jgi:glycerol kinase
MERFIVAIDQSTSASKSFLMDARGALVRSCSSKHRQSFPQPGYAEHDAQEIWQNVLNGIQTVTQGLAKEQIVAIALCNQRETTVFWERETGLPVRPAIVWQDVRASELCRSLMASAEHVLRKTGLALSPYYPAAKAAFALRDDPSLAARARRGEICIGTVDSYLVYRLTNGRVFRTDVSNASRTQLLRLDTLQWDGELCDLFGIPMDCLPEVVPSDGDFGVTSCEGLAVGIPITGVLGDSHASLFGHGCVSAGMTKTSYGTGSSVMMNVGETPVFSRHGLSASVGFGYKGSTCYVLEGNITCSGDTLCWLTEQAELAPDVASVEAIAAGVPDTQGVFLVPAFSGLGAPYFNEAARAAFVGMNRGTTRAHLVRAALESMAYQNADVIAAMEQDVGHPLTALYADGGGSHNHLLMQFQADLLGCEIRCAGQSELSALGAGWMAGLSTGFYTDVTSFRSIGARYQPTATAAQRASRMAGWRAAVNRCR